MHSETELFLNLAQKFSIASCYNSTKIIPEYFQSNFLGDFANLNPKKSKKGKSRQVTMETLWLELLLNLSFSMEGQQMILKITGIVSLISY